MKTRKRKNVSKHVLKYMAVFTCILLCTSFFVMPVSAAEGLTAVMFSIEVVQPHEWNLRVMNPGINSDYFSSANHVIFSDAEMANSCNVDRELATYNYDWVSAAGGVISLWLGRNTFTSDPITSDVVHTYSVNDTVWLDPGSFIAFTDNSYYALSRFRFVLREGDRSGKVGSVVAATDPIECYISEYTGFEPIRFEKLSFNFFRTVSCNNLSLCLEFYGSSMETKDLSISFLEDSFTINYGSGSDPNYPIYSPAPEGNVGNLNSSEEELIGSSEEGISQGLDKIQAFSTFLNDLDISNAALLRISQLMMRLVEIPSMAALVNISLSLGLFASLFALAGSLVSAADRRAGAAKREAATQEYRERRLEIMKNSGRRR